MAEIVDTRWFQDRLRDRQLSQRQLAARMKLDASAISLLLRGKREVKNAEAADIAQILGVPLNEVLAHFGIEVPKVKDETVPLVGTLDEHGEIHARKVGGRVPQPVDVPVNLVAVRVEDPASLMYGWVYYYEPRRDIQADCMDRLCVVKLPGGNQLVRYLRRGFEMSAYNLVSAVHQSMDGVRVTAAAPVLWIKTS